MRRQTEKMIKSIIKAAVVGAILFLYLHPENIKRLIYPKFYAKIYDRPLNVWETDVFSDLSAEQSQPIIRNYNGISITFLPQKSYAVNAKIGIIDRYDGLWEKFYHEHEKSRKIYNSFAPLDLALVHGKSAYHKKFNHCFKHEYRLLWSCPEINSTYFNNYHIIPATNNVIKGLETLRKGDIIHIEGLLVNVKIPSLSEMKTGTSHNMTHENQFAGGLYTGMCFIVYLKKLAVDGFVYE